MKGEPLGILRSMQIAVDVLGETRRHTAKERHEAAERLNNYLIQTRASTRERVRDYRAKSKAKLEGQDA